MDSLALLYMGLSIGLAAGFAPGPLLTLVISETLQFSILAGVLVALSPLVSDVPVMFFTLYFFKSIGSSSSFIPWLSMTGAFYLAYIGVKTITTKEGDVKVNKSAGGSFWRGFVANILSPHPYVFWFTVAGPLAVKNWGGNSTGVLFFFCAFYSLLVGCKIIIAILIGRSREFLKGRLYRSVMVLSGSALIIFACLLFYDGARVVL